jgi:hypothetical protein
MTFQTIITYVINIDFVIATLFYCNNFQDLNFF